MGGKASFRAELPKIQLRFGLGEPPLQLSVRHTGDLQGETAVCEAVSAEPTESSEDGHGMGPAVGMPTGKVTDRRGIWISPQKLGQNANGLDVQAACTSWPSFPKRRHKGYSNPLDVCTAARKVAGFAGPRPS